jgi:pimeloyl-ACP methyl ester carboxylesterase
LDIRWILIPIFKKDDIELYYIKEGEGEPLILVNGLGGKLTGWSFVIPFFKDKMQVISVDNRGTGKSSRPNYPYTMDMFVDDIKDLLDYLKIEKKIHLCGTSMGGMIAQNFSLKYPEMVKTLILVATTAQFDANPIIESQKLMEGNTLEQKFEIRIPAEYGRAFRKRLKKDKNLYEMLKKRWMEDQTRLQDFINQGAAASTHDTRESLYKITQPTIILVGNKDRIIPGLHHSEFLHEKIHNSRLEIIEGAGHGLPTDSADILNELIWDFLKDHLE